MTSAGIDEARRYWDERCRDGRTDNERVDQSPRAQRMRYEAFLLHHDVSGRSLVDIGCGTGALLAHLRRRDIDCRYTGIDIAAAMIERARRNFPGAAFAVASAPDGRYDYAVAIGIHNIKVTGGREILAAGMRLQFECCDIAAHLSLLTDRATGFADHVQAWKAEDVLAMALGITPYVVLRHDYLPNDFSVTLYRRPLIDTHPALLLDGP
jgi:SAM-dependent methyltransferase